MPARKIKTLLRNPNERSHREHRSKKGRRSHKYKKNVIALKKKRERIIKDELDDEMQSLVE